MRKKKKNCSIIADPGLMAMGIAFALVCNLMLIPIFWEMEEYVLSGDTEGIIGSLLVCGGIWLGAVLTSVWGMKQWRIKITFEEEAIQIKPTFCKPQYRPYKYYAYVYKGSYWHGSPLGVGKRVEYIVFSHGRLTDSQLYRINEVGKELNVLRIRYNKKNYDALIDSLPKEMVYKVKLCFPQN